MAAPVGNKYAIGNSGRAKKFSSPEEFQQFVDEYFQWCDQNPITEQNWVGKNGDQVFKTKQRPYTIEGLCLHLDIDRQTLLNYQNRKGYEDFFDIITRAKRKITQNNITYALTGEYNARLVQFLLSNNTEYKNQETHEVNLGEDTIKAIIVNGRSQRI